MSYRGHASDLHADTSHPNALGETSYKGDAAIVVIDDRLLHRDCFTRMLRNHMPFIQIEAVANLADIRLCNIRLFIVGAAPDKQAGSDQASFADYLRHVADLKRQYPDVPIMALLDNDDPARLRQIMVPDIAGVLPAKANIEIAIASIQLALAGGTFAPFDCMREGALPRQIQAVDTDADLTPAINDHRFTRREGEIIQFLQQGLPNKLIAYRLKISESTVKVHLRNVMKKLKARNRTQALFLMRQSRHTQEQNLAQS
ncbi:MAG: response regulator transcription factor [Hyphomicrobiales bacterium]|nr:response regulator transcription factor [Hyphomicrobiales bacterium]MDE2113398.1 response regulator transcription factor [Hyphomicrobiales bacterium]